MITLVSAILRLRSLGSKSFWYDEIISVNIASHSLGEILRARLRIRATPELVDYLYTNYPSFHLIIIHLVSKLSTTEYALRLPFALAGIATIPVVFALVKRLFGRDVALSTALLIAFSPLHISYSQEARPTVFLVLFSLLGLNLLLTTVETRNSRHWAGFVIAGVLGVWTSYFALILVMPTLCVISALIMLRFWRSQDREGLLYIFSRFSISCVLIGLCAIPLLADLKATSEMNDAGVDGGGLLIVKWLLSALLVVLLANPIPGHILPALLIAVPLTAGLARVIRRRSMIGAISVSWVGVPLLILGTVDSNHVIEMRYILFGMPLVLAIALADLYALLDQFIRRYSDRTRRFARSILMSCLIALSVVGLSTPVTKAVQGQPLKPDWKAVVQQYATSETSGSCLIIIDHSGQAMQNVVKYYLGKLESNSCTVDARDPRLADVLASHPDLWWAVGTQYYSDEGLDSLTREFSSDSVVSPHFLTLLIHPFAFRESDEIGDQPVEFLERAIRAVEPAGSATTSQFPAFRESLVNLLLLRCGVATPASTITSLMDGYLSYVRVNNDLTWERARERLARGDVEGARVLAIRMIGYLPGNPDVYQFLADVESAAGRSDSSGYAWAASVLSEDSLPAEALDFTGC